MLFISQTNYTKQTDLNGKDLKTGYKDYKKDFSYIYTCGICGSKVDFVINGICDSCRFENQKPKRVYRDGEVLEGIYLENPDLYFGFECKHLLAVKRMDDCTNKHLIYTDANNCKPNRNKVFVTEYLCHENYCINERCINFRIERAFEALNDLGIQKNKTETRCKGEHFSIGSLYRNKDQLLKVKNKLLRKIKYKYGFFNKNLIRIKQNKKVVCQRDLIYISVFDIGRKNFEKYKKYYNHLHIAIFGINNTIIARSKKFTKDCNKWIKAIDPYCHFNNIGIKTKSNIFNYFAKRIAGVFGHNKTGFYYFKDMMNKKEYLEAYFSKKMLSYHLAVGLVYKSISYATKNCCKYCKNPLAQTGDYDLNEKGEPPPEIIALKHMDHKDLLNRKTTTETLKRKLNKGYQILFQKITIKYLEIEEIKLEEGITIKKYTELKTNKKIIKKENIFNDSGHLMNNFECKSCGLHVVNADYNLQTRTCIFCN